MTIQDLRVPFQVLMGSPLHNHVGQKPQKRKTKECQDHSVLLRIQLYFLMKSCPAKGGYGEAWLTSNQEPAEGKVNQHWYHQTTL